MEGCEEASDQKYEEERRMHAAILPYAHAEPVRTGGTWRRAEGLA